MSLLDLPVIPEPKKEILFAPFPKQQQFMDAALSGQYTFVLYGGAIRTRG